MLVERGAAYGLRPVGGLAMRPDDAIGGRATDAGVSGDSATGAAPREAVDTDTDTGRDETAPYPAFGSTPSEPTNPNRTWRPRPQRPRPGQDGDR